MKRLFLCVIVVLIFFQAEAQRALIGVKLNPQLSWLSVTGEGLLSDGVLPGLDFGLILDTPLAEQYYFNTGISLSTIGGSLVYSDTFKINMDFTIEQILPDEPQKFKTTYLKIPVGLKFKTSPQRSHLFYAEIGLDAMFRLRSVLISENDKTLKHSVSSEINSFNLAYHIGGGVELYLRDETVIQTGLVFSQGFINAIQGADYQLHQNMLALSMALFF